MNSQEIQEAVKRSIMTERGAMLFYQQSAQHMKDIDAKKTFELLAREEREHAEQFFSLYQGDDLPSFEEFITAPGSGTEWLGGMTEEELAGMNERKAMELAMEKEKQLEAQLREMAAKIDDPSIRGVYLENAESTHNHYMVIESEYARLMGMVHESDIDTFVRE